MIVLKIVNSIHETAIPGILPDFPTASSTNAS
jgi:hypothetical protein